MLPQGWQDTGRREDGEVKFIVLRHDPHTLLTWRRKTVLMITRRMKTRRHLRSVRTSALPQEERRLELREAEARAAQGDSQGEPTEPEVSPRPSSPGAPGLSKAEAERAGVGEPD